MPTSADAIAELLTTRVHSQSAVQAQMRDVKETYNGDLVLPLPEIDKSEKPAIANLVAQGVDHMAQRYASRLPQTFFEPTRAGNEARQRADDRKAVVHGYWSKWSLQIQQYRRGRWWFGYGNYCSTVMPSIDPKSPIPIMRSWNPLDCYPAPRAHIEDIVPDDVLITSQRTFEWLRLSYPDQAVELRKALAVKGTEARDDLMVTLVTYIDAEEVVLVATATHPRSSHPEFQLGALGTAGSLFSAGDPSRGFELRRFAHGLGMPPITHPSRITLDRITGQYDEIIGMYQTQAKLSALNLHAVVRSIFPETWMVGRGQEEIAVSQRPDPARGQEGRVTGATIETVNIDPGLLTNSAIDRLERNQRVTAGIPAEFGGESPSNVRTDRRGLTIQDATISFKLAEAQTVAQKAIRVENELAMLIDQRFHNRRKVIAIDGFGKRGKVDYTPTEIFEESTDHRTTYHFIGTDAAALTVRLGQKVGARFMSRKSAMEADPDIEDVDAEMDLLVAQQLFDAQLSALASRAASGEIPEADIARIIQLVESDQMELPQAILQVQEEAQERQAQQLPAGDPGLQPGLANPGAGIEASPIPEPPQGVENFRSGLFGLVQSAELAGRI